MTLNRTDLRQRKACGRLVGCLVEYSESPRRVHLVPLGVTLLLYDDSIGPRSYREAWEMGQGKRSLCGVTIEQVTHQWAVGDLRGGERVGVFSTAIMHLLKNVCLIFIQPQVKVCFEDATEHTGYKPPICGVVFSPRRH